MTIISPAEHRGCVRYVSASKGHSVSVHRGPWPLVEGTQWRNGGRPGAGASRDGDAHRTLENGSTAKRMSALSCLKAVYFAYKGPKRKKQEDS